MRECIGSSWGGWEGARGEVGINMNRTDWDVLYDTHRFKTNSNILELYHN